MSRLAGLARNTDKKDGLSGLNSASPSPSMSASTAPSDSEAAPSLSAMASGARPRQSLTGLGRAASGGTSLSSLAAHKEGGDMSSAGAGSPLQDIARTANEISGTRTGLARSAGGLTRLAAAASSTTASRNSGNIAIGGGQTSSRPSLTSLARPREPSTTTSTATGPFSPPNTSITPSLTQLAAATQNSTPRRSLTSLAKPAQAPQKSSTSTTTTGLARPSIGLTARSGGGLSGLGGLGGSQRNTLLKPTTPNSTSESPSLQNLVSSSLQQRSSPSLATLSKRSFDSASATTEAPEPSSVYTQPSEHQPSLQSSESLHGAQETHSTALVADTATPNDSATPAPFSSLIAPPSHFAVSIFERLDPVPSPIALSTATILQSDPALLRGILASSGTITPTKVFQFDMPSPDDIVFKAQGQRPTAARI